MGISTLDPNGNYGPPLAIGAGEVKLADMVQAFSVFANNGVKRDYYSILKVVDREGDTIYEKKTEEDTSKSSWSSSCLFNKQHTSDKRFILVDDWMPGHTTAAKPVQ